MNPFILCPGGPNGSSDAQIELVGEQNCGACESAPWCFVSRELLPMPADGAGSKVHLRCPFQGARRALADAPGAANPLGGWRATAGHRRASTPHAAASSPPGSAGRRARRGAGKAARQRAWPAARRRRGAPCRPACGASPPRATAADVAAVAGRDPLRCQHGRRWSQSGRGWQGYILWHLRGC
jgi:hypothetical protein